MVPGLQINREMVVTEINNAGNLNIAKTTQK